jgi:hypothetical protein
MDSRQISSAKEGCALRVLSVTGPHHECQMEELVKLVPLNSIAAF